MTASTKAKPDLDAIEARRTAAMNEFWPETPKRCQIPIRIDIPALTTALREAWEENARLEKRLHDCSVALSSAHCEIDMWRDNFPEEAEQEP